VAEDHVAVITELDLTAFRLVTALSCYGSIYAGLFLLGLNGFTAAHYRRATL